MFLVENAENRKMFLAENAENRKMLAIIDCFFLHFLPRFYEDVMSYNYACYSRTTSFFCLKFRRLCLIFGQRFL